MLRWDWRFWSKLKVEFPWVEYGDYGIAHPSLPTGFTRGPLPSLRYTHEDKWIVWRESTRRQHPKPNTSFFDVVKGIKQTGVFKGAGYSWGDAELDLRDGRDPNVGSGNASNWRSWATSHHLQVVADHLSNQPGTSEL